MFRKKKGQSTAEYAILIGLVIASIVAIQPYVKRTLQGKYRVEADTYVTKLGSQLDSSELGLTPTTPIAAQFEFDQTVSRSTQKIIAGSGTESTMAVGGQTTRISTNISEQEAEDYRGYSYRQGSVEVTP